MRASAAAPAYDVRDTYEVLAKLAEGGMGAVYLVRHRHLDQQRVIKVMRPQLGEDAGFAARFVREARIEAELQHPNVAQLYEFEVAPSGVAYMVMEHIAGATLKDVFAAGGPLSIGLAAEVATQAAAALGCLHERGLVHRDVSPDNLMLTRDATGRPLVKLIDLGIAKRAQEDHDQRITVTGTFLGKVHYASPEQFGGDGLDGRSDIYSLGVALYELTTGVLPIRGTDTNSLIAGHLLHPPVPFAESDPAGRVPEPLRALLLRALEKDRDDRFATTADLAAALAPVREEHPVDAAEVERLLERAHREPQPLAEGFSLDLGTLATRSRPDRATLPSGETAATVRLPAAPRRVLGLPPRVLGLGAAVVAAGGIGLAVLLSPDQPAPPPREPTAAELVAADAALVADLPFGDFHALVIGNDAYRNLEPLHTAARDARAVADLLEERYGFAVTTLVDASREAIFAAVAELGGRLDADDDLLVYYAGHGVAHGNSLYWQPVDAERETPASWLAAYDLNVELAALPVRHVLVVADSCYSGYLGSEGGEPPAPLPGGEGESRAEEIRRRLGRTARLALSSGGLAPVADAGIGGEHSVFARTFLELLRENRRLLSAGGLFAELAPRVTERAQAAAFLLQQPVYATLPDFGDEGGEFFFVPVELRSQAP